MSRKIYDAYALPAGTDPVMTCVRLGETLEPAWRRFVLEAVGAAGLVLHELTVEKNHSMGDAVKDMCDLFGFGHVPKDQSERLAEAKTNRANPLGVAIDVVEAAHRVSDRFDVHPVADFRFSLRWLVDPAPNQSGRHDLYVLLSTTRQEYRDVFTDTTGATDFHYQNNADMPEDVTETEWQLREGTWERIIPPGGHPQMGPVWELGEDRRLTFESLRVNFAPNDAWLTRQSVCEAVTGKQSAWVEFRDVAHQEAFTRWFTQT